MRSDSSENSNVKGRLDRGLAVVHCNVTISGKHSDNIDLPIVTAAQTLIVVSNEHNIAVLRVIQDNSISLVLYMHTLFHDFDASLVTVRRIKLHYSVY